LWVGLCSKGGAKPLPVRAIETESASVVKGKVFSKITEANIYGNGKQAENSIAKSISVKIKTLPALNCQ
jgi:hypothetical protein